MCELPSVFRAQAVCSRADRVCEECFRAIPAGELHESVFGIWEGAAETIRTCAACFEIREELRELKRDDGGYYDEEILCDLAFGRLRDALAEEIHQMAPPAIGRSH